MKINRSIAVSLTIALAFFMQFLDTTAVNTAIPVMARSFGVDVVHLSSGITSYLIALAIFIPISGWVADRYSVRNVFCSAVALFTVASILCGTSQTLTQFVIFRVLQGMAGALMTPVGRLAVLKSTPKDKLVSAIAYLTWPSLIAPILGPVVGGYLALKSWHLIFLLNVPISILCIILAWRLIPKDDATDEPRKRFDAVGFVLSGAALAGFMFGTELLSRPEVSYFIPAGIIALSIVLLLFNIKYSRHISNPLIDYSVAKVPSYRVTIFTGSISRMVIGVAPFLIPLMFQVGFGLDSFQAGSLFLAMMAGNLFMKPATLWIIRNFKFKNVLIVNGILVTVFSLLTGFLLPTTPKVLILGVLFFSGMFRSMQFSSITTLAFADIPENKMTPANTLYSTIQQMSTGMGIALGAVFLRISHAINQNTGNYTIDDFRLTFIFVSVIGFISLYGYTKLSPTAGDAVRNKKTKT